VRRVEVTANVAAEGAAVVERVSARGDTRLERLVSLVLLGDLVSLYMAVLRGVDPVSVRAIEVLKERLSAARA
jgi:glucose/mannose-6-phosphate isomerase